VRRRTGVPVTFETVPRREHFALVEMIGTDGDPTTELIARFVNEARMD